jgi:hypothetical protein
LPGARFSLVPGMTSPIRFKLIDRHDHSNECEIVSHGYTARVCCMASLLYGNDDATRSRSLGLKTLCEWLIANHFFCAPERS